MFGDLDTLYMVYWTGNYACYSCISVKLEMEAFYGHPFVLYSSKYPKLFFLEFLEYYFLMIYVLCSSSLSIFVFLLSLSIVKCHEMVICLVGNRCPLSSGLSSQKKKNLIFEFYPLEFTYFLQVS